MDDGTTHYSLVEQHEEHTHLYPSFPPMRKNELWKCTNTTFQKITWDYIINFREFAIWHKTDTKGGTMPVITLNRCYFHNYQTGGRFHNIQQPISKSDIWLLYFLNYFPYTLLASGEAELQVQNIHLFIVYLQFWHLDVICPSRQRCTLNANLATMILRNSTWANKLARNHSQLLATIHYQFHYDEEIIQGWGLFHSATLWKK